MLGVPLAYSPVLVIEMHWRVRQVILDGCCGYLAWVMLGVPLAYSPVLVIEMHWRVRQVILDGCCGYLAWVMLGVPLAYSPVLVIEMHWRVRQWHTSVPNDFIGNLVDFIRNLDMPISGPTSYVSTTEEFLTHWGVADATLGAGNEVVLQGGVTRANLQTLLDSLVAKRLDLTAKLNIQETSRGDIELKKAALLLRINQFNEVVRADFAGTKWESALANVPAINDGQGVFVPALEDASTLWV